MQRFRTATLWYTVVGLIGPVVALVLTPVYTRAIGVAGYGTVDIVQSFWQGVYTVAFWGMGTVLAGMYTRHTDEAAKRTVLTSALVTVLASAVIVGAVVWWQSAALAAQIARPEVAPLLPLLAAALPFAVVNAALQAVFRIRLDISRSVAATLGLVVFTALTRLTLVVWAGQGVPGMVRALVLTNVLMALLCVVLGRHVIGTRVDGALVRASARAGLPLLPVSITGWVLLYADRWLLAPQVSALALGHYALAVLVASLAAFVFEPLKNAWQPIALRSTTPEFAVRSLRLACGVVVVVVCGVVGTAPLLLAVIGGTEALAAAPLVLPLLSMPAAGVFQALLGLRAVKQVRTGVLGVSGVTAAVVNVGVNLVVIPHYGVMGAAWATAVAAVCGTVVLVVREWSLVRGLLQTPEPLLAALATGLVCGWWWTGWLGWVIALVAVLCGLVWQCWRLWPQWQSGIDPE